MEAQPEPNIEKMPVDNLQVLDEEDGETMVDGVKMERKRNEVKQEKKKKRKREKGDDGSRGDGPDGFEKPIISPQSGGPPDLKKFREADVKSRGELFTICESFKTELEHFVEDSLAGKTKIKMGEAAVEWLKKSRSIDTDYFVENFTGALPMLMHRLNCHYKIVDNVLNGMGITKEDLQDEVYYKSICDTIKHLLDLCETHKK